MARGMTQRRKNTAVFERERKKWSILIEKNSRVPLSLIVRSPAAFELRHYLYFGKKQDLSFRRFLSKSANLLITSVAPCETISLTYFKSSFLKTFYKFIVQNFTA